LLLIEYFSFNKQITEWPLGYSQFANRHSLHQFIIHRSEFIAQKRILMAPLFSIRRLRRLRMTPQLRALVRETELNVGDLVYPLFACTGSGVRREVASMPGVFNLSVDQIVEECRAVAELGIPAVLLFGIPEKKDEQAGGAWDDDGIVQQALRAVKAALGERLVLIADTCLCEYMSHGHCGVVGAGGEICNDPTLELLRKTAVSQARAGADIIAPSDMMDGRVGAIRGALDEAGLINTPILSYAVKYASAFYGPFRDAAQSPPAFGDRKSHQMDPANLREAIEEARADVEEGADMLMVKPGGPNLDVIAALRREFNLPLAAYMVSGEYAMLKAAARLGWLDEKAAMWEYHLAMKRAGTDIVITYYAKNLATILKRDKL
jgi:porphobilinogen synthase